MIIYYQSWLSIHINNNDDVYLPCVEMKPGPELDIDTFCRPGQNDSQLAEATIDGEFLEFLGFGVFSQVLNGHGSKPMVPYLGGWTSINPSYFDVHQGYRVLTHNQLLGHWATPAFLQSQIFGARPFPGPTFRENKSWRESTLAKPGTQLGTGHSLWFHTLRSWPRLAHA